MDWGPVEVLRNVLWICGAQWAGKTSVSCLISQRFGLTVYHYDAHDSCGHYDRALARSKRFPAMHAWQQKYERDPDQAFVRPSPREMAMHCKDIFVERFEMTLDDLRALSSGRPLVAEGWGLRPELIAPLVDSPRKVVVLVPTEEYRQHQLKNLPRAGRIHTVVSDPERAQRNRVERDRIIARDAVESARSLGFRVIEVDGTLGVGGLTDVVQEHFRPHLPRR